MRLIWEDVKIEAAVENWDNDLKVEALEDELKKEDPSATATLDFNNIEVVYKECEVTLLVDSAITIMATEMTEAEILERGIIKEDDDSIIIKVVQIIDEEPLSIEDVKSNLQTLEEKNPDKVYRMFVNAYFGDWLNSPDVVEELKNYTWEQFVDAMFEKTGLIVENVNDAFWVLSRVSANTAFDYNNGTEIVVCHDVYDLIIQSSKKLVFECNNVSKTGLETYFEIKNEGEYKITAKKENNDVVATTKYNAIFYAKIVLTDGTEKSLKEFEGKTWYEFATDPSNVAIYRVQYDYVVTRDLKDIIVRNWFK